jgi:hypothetical protein
VLLLPLARTSILRNVYGVLRTSSIFALAHFNIIDMYISKSIPLSNYYYGFAIDYRIYHQILKEIFRRRPLSINPPQDAQHQKLQVIRN